MTRELFKQAIAQLKVISDYTSQYDNFGIDLFESKYPIASEFGTFESLFWESHYDVEGRDWIYWFIYENDFGEGSLTANELDGTPICRTVDELYDYVEKYRIK